MIHAALAIPARPISRSQRLMEATRSAHDGLDTRIISAEPVSYTHLTLPTNREV